MSHLVHHVSRDAGEISLIARAWDADFRPMETAPGESELLQTVDPQTVMSFARLAPRVEQRGAAPKGMRTFALLARGAPPIRWCGQEVGETTLMCFGAGGEFECSSPRGFEVHTLSVDANHLGEIAAKLGFRPDGLHREEPRIAELGAGRASALRKAVESATRLVLEARQVPAPVRSALAEEVAPEMLRAALGSSSAGSLPSPRDRDRALRAAVEYLEAHAHQAPRIPEICAVAGCSERTLRYAFQERFDMSPKAYLQATRLNGVRRELRAGASVSDAADRWGFWHMSQLAADYRRLFGELPSATAARAR